MLTRIPFLGVCLIDAMQTADFFIEPVTLMTKASCKLICCHRDHILDLLSRKLLLLRLMVLHVLPGLNVSASMIFPQPCPFGVLASVLLKEGPSPSLPHLSIVGRQFLPFSVEQISSLRSRQGAKLRSSVLHPEKVGRGQPFWLSSFERAFLRSF